MNTDRFKYKDVTNLNLKEKDLDTLLKGLLAYSKAARGTFLLHTISTFMV